MDRALGPVHGVIAHSIGAVAAAVALRDGLRADAAVLLAPPADLALYAELMLEALGFGRRARDVMRERVEPRLGVPWSTLAVGSFAPQMRTPHAVGFLGAHPLERAGARGGAGAGYGFVGGMTVNACVTPS